MAHYHVNVIYRTTLFVALFIIYTQSVAQTIDLNGLYISISNKKNCTNTIPVLVGKGDYCVSKSPIISTAEFESVSKIRVDPVTKQKSITLKLSENGFKKWKGVLQNLPDALLVLVIDGYVVGTFKNESKHLFNAIPINASPGSVELEWIYEHLKK